MKPLAPARSAENTYSSRSKVVSTTTRGAASPSRSIRRAVVSTPSSTRHPHVHQDDVGRRDGERLERLASVARLAHDGHVGLGVDHQLQAGADERLVVDEEDPDARHDRTRFRGHRARDLGTDLEAALRMRAGAERAAARLDAFAHPDKPAAAPVAGGAGAAAVVAHHERDPVGLPAQLDARCRSAAPRA